MSKPAWMLLPEDSLASRVTTAVCIAILGGVAVAAPWFWVRIMAVALVTADAVVSREVRASSLVLLNHYRRWGVVPMDPNRFDVVAARGDR